MLIGPSHRKMPSFYYLHCFFQNLNCPCALWVQAKSPINFSCPICLCSWCKQNVLCICCWAIWYCCMCKWHIFFICWLLVSKPFHYLWRILIIMVAPYFLALTSNKSVVSSLDLQELWIWISYMHSKIAKIVLTLDNSKEHDPLRHY